MNLSFLSSCVYNWSKYHVHSLDIYLGPFLSMVLNDSYGTDQILQWNQARDNYTYIPEC